MSTYLGFHDLSKEARRAAWLLMLKIDLDSNEMATHREIYSMFLGEQCKPKSKQFEIEALIVKDVPRTFSTLKLFGQNPSTGQNKLYNILKVYSIFDPDVGYT